jgi:hypothetical protein
MTRKASSKKRPPKPGVTQVRPLLNAEWSEAEPIAGQQDVDERTYDFRAAIAELAELGIAELARMGFKTTEPSPRLTRERTLLELFDLCRTRGLPYDKDVVYYASTQVLAHFDRLPRVGDYYLSVGELRERLAGLPAHMPVAYQRIEDHFFQSAGWKTYPFVFESIPMDAQLLTPAERRSKIKRLREGRVPGVRVRERGGRLFQEGLSEYIVGWSGGVRTDDEGRRMFLIDAHY